MIVIEGDTTGQTDEHASAYTVNVVDSTIRADSTTGNTQSILVYNNPSVSNSIALDGCTLELANDNCVFLIDAGEETTTKIRNTTVSGTGELPVLPEGYVFSTADADGFRTVMEGTYVAQIGETKYETLAEAVAAAQTGDTVEILVAGTYTLPNLPKNITIEGAVDGVVFEHTSADNIASTSNGATFRNVTFNLGNNNYHGFQHNGGLTFENCTFNGKFFTYGTETYKNCTFNHSGDYNMWVYGGNNTVTYDGCTFENTGKFLNVYNENGAPVTLNITNCTFINSAGSANKAAVNVKETCGTTALHYNVKINGSTLEGPFPSNSIADDLVVGADGLWQVDDRLANIDDSGITVTLEGEVVYPFFVAQIGDVKYETLAKAVAAVPADGTETLITMIDNEMINVVGSGVTIPAGKNVVLDLNGFQVVGTATQGSTSALITNKGTLTIQDSSTAGTGKLISGATDTWIYNGDGNYAGSYASNTITNSGTLTVESGYIENLSTGSATYAIDNNSSGADAIVTINGGTVKGHSVAIRQFANSTAKENSVTVNGGLVEAGYSGIWIQLPGSDATKAMKATLNVTDGELKGGSFAFYDYSYGNSFDATQYNLSGGTLNGTVFSYGANIDISGGTYNGEVAIKQAKPSTVSVTGGYFGDDVYTYGENASEGFITGGYFASLTYENDGKTYDCDWISLLHPDYKYVDNTDEDSKDAYPYKVVPKEYVAENTNTGVKYETLEAAIAAAQDGETITVPADCSGNGIKAPQGKFATTGLTVDFAGHTYTVDGATVGSTGTETNGFQLLKDNKITFKNGTISSEKAKILIQNYSDLTLDGMTLELNNANYSSAYTLSNNNGNVVIKNSTINANSGGGFAFDVCRYASYPSVNVTVTGNSVIDGDIEVSASGRDAKDGFSLMLESGTFNGKIVLDPSAEAAMEATPDKAMVKKTTEGVEIGIPADYKWIETETAGVSKLVKKDYVAENTTTGAKYETLTEAVNAAADGQTVKLLEDLTGELSEYVIINNDKTFTVDLDGHTADGRISLKRGHVTIDNGQITDTSKYGMPLEVTAFKQGEGTNSLTLGENVTVTGKYGLVLWNASGSKEGYGSTITVNGKIEGVVFVSGNLQQGDSIITVNGSIESAGHGIALNGYAVVNVADGASIVGGETGIEVRAGELNVTGGTITGNGTPTATNPNGSGTTSVGAGIAVAQHTTKLPIEVNITGGTISGYTAFYESNPQNNSAEDLGKIQVSITGGNFVAINGGAKAIHADDLEGFVSAVVDGEGTFTSQPWASSKIDETYVADGFVPSDEMEHDPAYTIVVERKVTFDPDNGEEKTTVSVADGSKVEKPDPDPVKDGYIFKFWSADGEHEFDFANTLVKEDLTLTAIWEGKEYIVTATSASGSLDGPSMANVQGGGRVQLGESTTLIAPDVDGYNFAGWYCDGVLVSSDQVYVFTPTSESADTIAFIALYNPMESGRFRLEVTGSKFKVSNMNATQRSYFDDWYTADTQVTVTFIGSSDETFLYWVNGNGKIMSTSPEYTFYMVYHTEIHAVYSDADTTSSEALVIFLNSNSNPQVLASHYYTSEETIQFPQAPTKLGSQFVGWSMTEDEIKAAMASESKIVVVAKYKANNKYTITIRNNKNSEVTVTDPIPSGNQYAITADDSLGTFSYWIWNDKIIAYSPSIIVRFTDDVVLTAVYDQDVEPAPVITMTGSSSTVEDVYGYTFVITRSVPEGWTLERQGILYTCRTDLDGKDLKSEIVLGGNQVTDKDSNNLDLNGVFAFTVKARVVRTYYARGFMIVMKDGVSQVIYSDEILEQSYEP